MIVLRTPKGWTGPKEVDGLPVEGNWHSHQVPFADARSDAGHRRMLEEWMRSYRPEELFDATGAPEREMLGLVPTAGADERQPARQRRAAARDLVCRTSASTASRSSSRAPAGRGHPGARRPPARRDAATRTSATSGSSAPTRPSPTGSAPPRRDRRVGMPDPRRDDLAPDGRVMEILSEHTCQGWLEGYLLTGRHGLFSCYEAFMHIVDSMFNQHAKWMKVSRHPVAAPGRVAQLPAHLPRLAAGPQRLLPPGPGLHRPRDEQEGRGDSRLPAARRQHVAVRGGPLPAEPEVRQRDRGRQAALPVRLDMDEAIIHCTTGLGIWDWASIVGGRGARCRDGLRGRRPDPGDTRCRRPAAGFFPTCWSGW